LALNPNYAASHAYYLIEMGRGPESLAEIGKAEQLDPFSAENVYLAGWFLFYSGPRRGFRDRNQQVSGT